MLSVVRPVVAAVLVGALAACSSPTPAPVADAVPAEPVSPAPTPSEPATSGPAPDQGTVVHSEQVPALHPSVDAYPRGVVELVAGDGTVHRLAVLVADTDERRSHGLMEVPDVPTGTGMVFTFAADRSGGFWMKGTLTPLQIAWADADGTIVAVRTMEPCEADPCPSYEPGATYRTALEVRAGWLDEIGVGVGDRLRVLAGG